jgi:hypothetical protein
MNKKRPVSFPGPAPRPALPAVLWPTVPGGCDRCSGRKQGYLIAALGLSEETVAALRASAPTRRLRFLRAR